MRVGRPLESDGTRRLVSGTRMGEGERRRDSGALLPRQGVEGAEVSGSGSLRWGLGLSGARCRAVSAGSGSRGTGHTWRHPWNPREGRPRGWGFGTKRGPSVAWAGNRTRASRVAGENSTTEPPMHPWRTPSCNPVTVATAFRELLLGGTVKEAGGMDGGPWASCSRRGRGRVRTPRVEVDAGSPGPCTSCASPGSPDRHARCRPRKPGAGPNYALTGISIRAGELRLGGCLLVHPHPPVAKLLAARASRRRAARDRSRRPSQPAADVVGRPRESRRPREVGGGARVVRPGLGVYRRERQPARGRSPPTHQGNRPSVLGAELSYQAPQAGSRGAWPAGPRPLCGGALGRCGWTKALK